uniref:Malectin-like domain-containing protein n=1 Tax=Populus trichocarpa TaxID=3694 RepID=A0A2K1YA11_POPTR
MTSLLKITSHWFSYLFNVSSDRLSLIFKPKERSFAFVNAIEVVSAPDGLISDSASTVPQGGGLFKHAFKVCCRLNVGGPTITPMNHTLSSAIKYPQSGATPYVAPDWVYATADEMEQSETLQPNFNLMSVDPSGFRLGAHASGIQSGMPNAILNGLEVIKMSNYVGSLDGLFGVDGSSERHRMKIVAGVGLAMVVTALMLLLAIVYIRWPKGPQDWEKQNSRFSSWPSPLLTSHCSFLNIRKNYEIIWKF